MDLFKENIFLFTYHLKKTINNNIKNKISLKEINEIKKLKNFYYSYDLLLDFKYYDYLNKIDKSLIYNFLLKKNSNFNEFKNNRNVIKKNVFDNDLFLYIKKYLPEKIEFNCEDKEKELYFDYILKKKTPTDIFLEYLNTKEEIRVINYSDILQISIFYILIIKYINNNFKMEESMFNYLNKIRSLFWLEFPLNTNNQENTRLINFIEINKNLFKNYIQRNNLISLDSIFNVKGDIFNVDFVIKNRKDCSFIELFNDFIFHLFNNGCVSLNLIKWFVVLNFNEDSKKIFITLLCYLSTTNIDAHDNDYEIMFENYYNSFLRHLHLRFNIDNLTIFTQRYNHNDEEFQIEKTHNDEIRYYKQNSCLKKIIDIFDNKLNIYNFDYLMANSPFEEKNVINYIINKNTDYTCCEYENIDKLTLANTLELINSGYKNQNMDSIELFNYGNISLDNIDTHIKHFNIDFIVYFFKIVLRDNGIYFCEELNSLFQNTYQNLFTPDIKNFILKNNINIC